MMQVYHGAACEVQKPIVGYGRSDLDFGQGFYVTVLREQAEQWARTVAMRVPRADAILNIYELDIDYVYNHFHCLIFKAYDRAWLDFIVQSRSGERPWVEYDFIEGGVANDRVIDTVEGYMAGMMSADFAIALLAQHQPNHLMCFLNQRLVDRCLHFKESFIVQLKKKGGRYVE